MLRYIYIYIMFVKIEVMVLVVVLVRMVNYECAIITIIIINALLIELISTVSGDSVKLTVLFSFEFFLD